MPAQLPVAERREVFAILVAKQDEGLSVAESRAFVSREYRLEAREVLAIEQEGTDAGWPPLDA